MTNVLTEYDVRPPMLAVLALLRSALASTAGNGARLTAQVAGGAVAGVSVVDGGEDYGEYVRVVFVGGGGSGAEAIAHVVAGAIDSVTLLSGGRSYTSAPQVRVEPYVRSVYDNIPRVFSESAPFVLAQYRGGEFADRLAYSEGTSRRFRADYIVCQALASETETADQLTREFVGVFLDLIKRNSELDGVTKHVSVLRDSVQTVPVNGAGNAAVTYLANVFSVEFEDSVL